MVVLTVQVEDKMTPHHSYYEVQNTVTRSSLFLLLTSSQFSRNSTHHFDPAAETRLEMLGKSLVSPLLTFDSTPQLCNYPDSAAVTTSKLLVNVNLSPHALQGGRHATISASKKWELHSAAQTQNVILSDEDKKTWESCREALSAYGFTREEEDKILGKAFGQIHSPYWGEERKKEMPKFEVVSEILSYLKDLGLTDDDLGKVLKKFPEVLGCSLENEVKPNVQILDKQWGITGKTLRNLLLRNPKALGYIIDCKGDCMALCTRCWVRF